jgi:hypothetical protein
VIKHPAECGADHAGQEMMQSIDAAADGPVAAATATNVETRNSI